MFANLFPKRDRFTPANVRRLADALARTPAVTPANGDHLVETFREIAELMIYGDQNDPSFFDLFVELKVMSHISRFVKQSGSRPGSSKLTLQLLQTLSIMIQNTREETSLFYLFSNDHVPKELIEHDFDFVDEFGVLQDLGHLLQRGGGLHDEHGDGQEGHDVRADHAPELAPQRFALGNVLSGAGDRLSGTVVDGLELVRVLDAGDAARVGGGG